MAYDGIINAPGCIGGCDNCIGEPIICEDCAEAYDCEGECACIYFGEMADAADMENLAKVCGAAA